ncbi:hypothetical protein EDD16DRAFT_1577133 [Pisolithus croceorrhizus]|nr:hypothetical protein EDD16DRAFT_1577133 [Pisolithus croceorrhizus]KAI6158666.1 hypothetical protein EDD17DRAFT_1621037 [Pisolithus thermaeus]
MGVAGLWEVLRPAAEVRSLTDLAVSDGFVANPDGRRGFRIGIDASIWFFHAAYGKEGENPELRTLFFRCCRLLQSPLLPLFVFDGPKRPAVKRGKRVGGNTHWLTTGMKNIIQAFGFEWRMAPGEAEAELAYLNRIGVIDAVLSDDVDNFLFGATMVIRNPSSSLSGNRSHPVKNSEGRDDGNHVLTYRASAISTHPSVQITRGGTILIALLSGGDYIPAGLPGCGKAFAVGLARTGLGESLVQAATTLSGERLDDFLSEWRDQIKAELRSNKSGFLPSKKPSLAASLPDSFPSIPVLLSYVSPITSETERPRHPPPPVMWPSDPDPAQIASLCELYFEWGVRDIIIKRFRTVLWPGIVCRALRRRVIDSGAAPGSDPCTQDHSTNLPTKVSSTFSTTGAHPQVRPSTTEGDESSSSPSVPFSLALFRLVSSASASSSDPEDEHEPALLVNVLSVREHSSTDGTPEYRVLIDPSALVSRAASGVRGIRPPLDLPTASEDGDDEVDEDEAAANDDDGFERLETAAQSKAKKRTKRTQSTPVSPTASLRLWLPAVMVRAVVPDLVDAYETKAQQRAEKKSRKCTKGSGTEKPNAKSKATAINAASGSTVVHHDAAATKPKRSTGKGRRKPKAIAEVQDEGYEYINLSNASTCSEDEPANAKGKGKSTAHATTVKRRPEARLTAEDSFPPVSPATAERVTRRPNLHPSPYDKPEEDRPLPESSLPAKSASVRPLDVLRQRTEAKSKGLTKPPVVQEERGDPASMQRASLSTSVAAPAKKPFVTRKPLPYVDVSSDEVEIAEIRTNVAVNAPVVKESRAQAAVTDFFAISKGGSGLKALSKPNTAKSAVKPTRINLLSDTMDCGEPSGTSQSTCTTSVISKGQPFAPRPFPMPSPVVTRLELQDRLNRQEAPPDTSTPGDPRRPSDSPTGVRQESLLPKLSNTVEILSDSDTRPKAKSPRTSPAHRSPRKHRSARDPDPPSSPTLLVTCLLAKNDPPNRRAEQPASKQLQDSAFTSTVQISTKNVLGAPDNVIWISSGSEDEDDVDEIGGNAGMAMILSAPPVLSEPESEPPVRARTSKFKPGGAPTATAAGSLAKVDLALDGIPKDTTVNNSRTKTAEQVKRFKEPPLLLARAKAKASKVASTATTSTRTTAGMRPKPLELDDIIDLT